MGEDETCQCAQKPEFDTYGRRRELTPISCPLTYTHIRKQMFLF